MTAKARLLSTVLALGLLAGCNDGSQEAEEKNALTGNELTAEVIEKELGIAEERDMAAADFDALTLGARITGPVGPTVDASLSTPFAALADLESYVACPVDIDPCDPKSAPAGTVYTYVHAVTPGIDKPNDPPFPQPEALEHPGQVTAFRVGVPLAGFTGTAGYSHGDARKALVGKQADGPPGGFSLACKDGVLIFRLDNPIKPWIRGKTIRFFWQSTVPPKGPATGYELYADSKQAVGQGPAPGAPSSSSSSSAVPREAAAPGRATAGANVTCG